MPINLDLSFFPHEEREDIFPHGNNTKIELPSMWESQYIGSIVHFIKSRMFIEEKSIQIIANFFSMSANY